MRTCSRRTFSLIELLIAIVILGMALATSLGIIGNASRNLTVAKQGWQDQHAVELATEYFLLAGPKVNTVPGGLLPDEYDATCNVVSSLDDAEMPEYAVQPRQGWMLAAYTIDVMHVERGEISRQVIWQIIKEDDLQ